MCWKCENADSLFGVGSQVSIQVRRLNHPPTPEQVEAERLRIAGLALEQDYRTLVESLWVGFGGSLGDRCPHCGEVLPDEGRSE